MIVVVIIAILASLLLPSLNSARRTAKSAACRTNLSQIGKAEFMYMADYDDWATPAMWSNVSVDAWFLLFNNNYIKSDSKKKDASVFKCPEERNYSLAVKSISYGINTLSFGESASGGGKNVIPHKANAISAFGRDSALAAFIDTPPSSAENAAFRSTSGSSWIWESSAPPAPIASTSGTWYPAYVRHPANTANAAFFDGHAGTLKGVDLMSGNVSAFKNPCMKAYGDGKLAIR